MSAAGARLTEQLFGPSTAPAGHGACVARLDRALNALAAKKEADKELKASLEALGWPAKKIALLMGAAS